MFKHFIAFSAALLLLMSGSMAGAERSAAFGTVADIHFDPFTTCADQSPCSLIQKLEAAPVAEWEQILTAIDKDAPAYKQDTNFTLLASTLTALQNAATKAQAKFVIIQGDVLGHHNKEKYQKFSTLKTDTGYQAFVQKTMTFLADQFKDKFPTTEVYFALGNNDSNLGDNISEPEGPFFSDMGNLWGQLIHNETNRKAMQESFKHAGYYAVRESSFFLIVMNTNLFSKNSTAPADAPNKELVWFEQQLEIAHQQNLQVLLVMHIPAGIDSFASLKQNPYQIIEMWLPEYTQRFKADVEEYAQNINGILTAHTHSDSFQVLTNRNGNKIPVGGTPGITPINGNNPGFKIYHFDPTTLVLRDYQTFYLRLSTMRWHKEYDFNNVYQTGCHDCTLVKGMELLAISGKLADAYQLYYDMQSNTDLIHNSYNPYYWCQLNTIIAKEYQNCINANIKL